MSTKKQREKLFAEEFSNLYSVVLKIEKEKFRVKEQSIRDSIIILSKIYGVDRTWSTKGKSNSSMANYNEARFRCAYLHKYAMCYTGMIAHFLGKTLDKSDDIYVQFDRIQNKTLNLCSLGGGPGSDVVGILAALCDFFIFDSISVSIIDAAINWKNTFSIVEQEITSGRYDAFKKLSQFHSEYLSADLLGEWSNASKVEQIIANADIISMVKFVSAAACNSTERMIQKIFETMKPGAMLLFADNAAGGFDHLMKKIAKKCDVPIVYGPLIHQEYENPKFNFFRFGYNSQFKAKITFIMFRKQMTFRHVIIEGAASSYRDEFANIHRERFSDNRIQERIKRQDPTLVWLLIIIIVICIIFFVLYSLCT